jgi:hypothetical protein
MPEVPTNMPDQDAIDAVNISRIIKAEADKNTTVGALRSAYAKAEIQNLNTEAAKIVIRLKKKGQSGIDDYFETIRKVADYARILGFEFSPAQYELFGDQGGPPPEDEKAADRGLAAGRAGDDASTNPYEVGSINGQAWLAKWHDGAAERALILAMPEPKEENEEEGDGDEEQESDTDDDDVDGDDE